MKQKYLNISEEILRQKYEVEGNSTIFIGKELNVSDSTISRRLKKYKILIRSSGESNRLLNKRLNLSSEILKQKYLIEKKLMSDIAKELSVSLSSVQRYLKKYNIQIR